MRLHFLGKNHQTLHDVDVIQFFLGLVTIHAWATSMWIFVVLHLRSYHFATLSHLLFTSPYLSTLPYSSLRAPSLWTPTKVFPLPPPPSATPPMHVPSRQTTLHCHLYHPPIVSPRVNVARITSIRFISIVNCSLLHCWAAQISVFSHWFYEKLGSVCPDRRTWILHRSLPPPQWRWPYCLIVPRIPSHSSIGNTKTQTSFHNYKPLMADKCYPFLTSIILPFLVLFF